MADPIIIAPSDLFVHVGIAPPTRITAFVAAGTMVSIEKVSNLSTFVEGQNNAHTHVINGTTGYRITLNVMQGSFDDAFLFGSGQAFFELKRLIPISVKYGNTVFASGSGGMEVIPTREIAADGSPTLAYAIVGGFPGAVVAAFGAPPQLTTEDINSFVPNP